MHPTILASTALLLCSLSLAAQTQQASDRIRSFAKAFSLHRKPADAALVAQRQKALAGIAKLDSAAVARALTEAYRKLDVECSLRREKRRRMLVKDNGKRLDRLRAEMRPSLAFQASIKRRLGALRSHAARLAIAKLLGDKRLALSLRMTGARLTAELLDGEHMKATAKPDIETLLVILTAAKSLERRGQSLGNFALQALQRPERGARQAALETLEALCWPASLKPLIAYLATEKDNALRERAGEALAVLTRQDLGSSALSWKAWLKDQGGVYLRGERLLGGGKPKAQRVKQDGYYFGLPLDQPSILFVHDNSLSMGARLGKTSRIERSRDELCKALDSLRSKQLFNIVMFANRVWQFEDRQIRASKKNITRAKTWLRAEKLEFGTATYNALEQAFVLAGRGSEDHYYEALIDTIYVLSDGAPTVRRPAAKQRQRGGGLRPDNVEEILAAVQRWNPFGRIQIHSIYLGAARPQARPVRFMRKLARQNRGRFRAAK